MKGKTLVSLLLCLLLVASFIIPAFGTESGRSGVFVTAFAEEGDGEDGEDPQNPETPPETEKPTEHTHTWKVVDEKKATCSEEGYVLSKCESCEETKTDTISKLAHTWEVVKNEKATCSQEGYVLSKCKVCGAENKDTFPKLPHTYDNACDPDCNVCGATRETSHVPNKIWSKNAGGHWHICTICGEKVDIADHYPGPAATEDKDQICMTCGYVMTKALGHVHKYEDTLSYDATGHWYACESCGEKKDFAEHVFDNPCDPDCNVCGYVSNNAHYYGDTLQYDDECHWGVCTLCGQEGDHLAHIPGDPATEDTPQICTICGKVLVQPLSHVHEGEEWTYDEETHTQKCSCGLIMEEGPHTWDEGTENPDGTVTYVCTACGAQRMEGEPKAAEAEFPWVMVIGIVALVCAVGAGVALVIVLAKKPAGKYSK